MVRSQRALLVVIALLCTRGAFCSAQPTSAGRPADAGSVGVWLGLAHHSPGRPFGLTVGDDLAMAAIRLTRTLHRSASWNLDYSVDIVPLAIVSTPSHTDVVALRACNPNAAFCELREILVEERAVYGFGGAPLGVQLRFAPTRGVQPFLTASGGALWFRQPVPVPQAGRFNFTAEVGAGILFRPTPGLGVTLGYKLQHISNGGTYEVNPGIDNNLFYVGLVRPIQMPLVSTSDH